MGVPGALKILSPDLTHKSDIGGVVLDLVGVAAVRETATTMLERIGGAFPEAHLEGLAVQLMVSRAGAHELIVGMVDDVQFRSVTLFGRGGTAFEVYADKALALPPLNMRLAREMMVCTRVNALLEGCRDVPAGSIWTRLRAPWYGSRSS